MYFLYDSSVGEGVCVGVGGYVWVIGWAMGCVWGGGHRFFFFANNWIFLPIKKIIAKCNFSNKKYCHMHIA